jgi:hypothetical protein
MVARCLAIAAALLGMVLLGIVCLIDPASASVTPSISIAAPAPVTPPKPTTFVAPNILPRLLVTSLPRR